MIVDIILLAILTITIMSYFRNGFAVSLFNTASAVISVVLIAMFHNPLTQLVKASPFGVWLYDTVNTRVSEMFISSGREAIGADEAPGFFQKMIDDGLNSVNDTVLELTDKILGIVVAVVVFLLLVVIFKIVSKVFPKILKAIVSLPILKQLDKLLGGALGIVVGIIWMVIGIYAIGLVSLVPALEFLDDQLANSMMLSALQNTFIGDILF